MFKNLNPLVVYCQFRFLDQLVPVAGLNFEEEVPKTLVEEVQDFVVEEEVQLVHINLAPCQGHMGLVQLSADG